MFPLIYYIDNLRETLCHKTEGRVLFGPTGPEINADPDPQHIYLQYITNLFF